MQTTTEIEVINHKGFFADILSAIDNEKVSAEYIQPLQSLKLIERINRMIDAGASFDVSIDDFQVIDNNQTLRASDKEFLEFNNEAVLCALQQSLLMKHLFTPVPELFEDFAFEIEEREAIMGSDEEEELSFFHLGAVKDVSRNWFYYLLSGS